LSTISKKIFPNLNAYRFLAALLVVFHHVEQIRYNAHLVNLKQYSLFNNGGLAVQFFFVLSGFLITYLLFNELESTKNISLPTFYLKRILRIWPLYYVLVFLGFVVLPLAMSKQASFINKFPYLNAEGLMLYLCILPNIANAIWSKHFLISLWSIGVEEQFYLF
jgi:peptidoglycan/LPS O-acetylase OafA/YrhL